MDVDGEASRRVMIVDKTLMRCSKLVTALCEISLLSRAL